MAEKFSVEQFIDAIPGTGGIVSAIAKNVGCDWHTARKYIDSHPTVKQAWDDERSTRDRKEPGNRALRRKRGDDVQPYSGCPSHAPRSNRDAVWHGRAGVPAA